MTLLQAALYSCGFMSGVMTLALAVAISEYYEG